MENKEKRGQKRLVMCKQLLVSTLVWSCPLPDMYNLSCSLSKLHFWVTGYSVWMCTYGGPSASYWTMDQRTCVSMVLAGAASEGVHVSVRSLGSITS